MFFTTEAGAVVVVDAGGDLTPKVVNELTEDTYATPAIADGRIYVRTTSALYAFGTLPPRAAFRALVNPTLRLIDGSTRISFAFR